MASKKLHPSVAKFKEFVKENPKLVQEVRSGRSTWQKLYEDWYLLGEEDTRWDSFRANTGKETTTETAATSEKKTDWISQVMEALKKMDTVQVQSHIQSLSQALSAVQGVISQFQGANQQPVQTKTEAPNHPFSFRKD